MKTLLLLSITALALLFHSCTYRCDCKKQCFFYDHDSIRVCTMSFYIDSAFQKLNDSLSALYGAPHDSSYGSDNVRSNMLGQYEQQGYSCACPK